MHDRHVGGGDGDVCPAPEGEADVGLRECGSIVDAVSDHADEGPGSLRISQMIELLLRAESRLDLLDADLFSYCTSHLSAVTREQDRLQSPLM